jgi:hypothetical protein
MHPEPYSDYRKDEPQQRCSRPNPATDKNTPQEERQTKQNETNVRSNIYAQNQMITGRRREAPKRLLGSASDEKRYGNCDDYSDQVSDDVEHCRLTSGMSRWRKWRAPCSFLCKGSDTFDRPLHPFVRRRLDELNAAKFDYVHATCYVSTVYLST